MTKRATARRALKMATATAGVAGSYLSFFAQSPFLGATARRKKLDATHSRAAKKLTDDLAALRGPAMKLGQALSIQSDFLPEAALAEFARLQMSAPGMHPTLVRAQFRSSMGKDPEAIFTSFDEKPFAAASLGQVHRATLKSGEQVAVKIQYPGIRAAIEQDIGWFRALSKPAQLSRHIPPFAIDEIRDQILAECDYNREAENARLFRDKLSRLGYVDVPMIHRDLSSDRVLTMSYLEGETLDAFLRRRPSQKLRDLVGERLFEMYYFQLMVMEALHADPHWGNYLFAPDGRIGLVDFGCVKYFAPAFVANLKRGFLFSGSRDSREFQQIIEERHAGPGVKLTRDARNALASMSVNFYGKVYPPEPDAAARPFDFGDPGVLKLLYRESAKLATAKAGLPEYVFLARSEFGLYQTLHRLKARVHTSAILRKWLAPPRALEASAR